MGRVAGAGAANLRAEADADPDGDGDADAESVGEQPAAAAAAAEQGPFEGTQELAKQRKRRRHRSPSEVCHFFVYMILALSRT